MNSALDCGKCGAFLTELIPKVSCGSGCAECDRYAYFADQPFYLYLLTHEQLKLHKIGIGSVGKDKNLMQRLVADGWKVHGLWHHRDKRTTFRWEQAIFRQLEALFSLQSTGVQGFIGKRDRHWVESISADAISLAALTKLASGIASDD